MTCSKFTLKHHRARRLIQTPEASSYKQTQVATEKGILEGSIGAPFTSSPSALSFPNGWKVNSTSSEDAAHALVVPPLLGYLFLIPLPCSEEKRLRECQWSHCNMTCGCEHKGVRLDSGISRRRCTSVPLVHYQTSKTPKEKVEHN